MRHRSIWEVPFLWSRVPHFRLLTWKPSHKCLHRMGEGCRGRCRGKQLLHLPSSFVPARRPLGFALHFGRCLDMARPFSAAIAIDCSRKCAWLTKDVFKDRSRDRRVFGARHAGPPPGCVRRCHDCNASIPPTPARRAIPRARDKIEA
jgi:hypothetical protein